MIFQKHKNKNKWVKSSYSQSGEDLIIKFIFEQLKIEKPSYMDVGAHHPFYLSNTALFYEHQCKGINIEPDPALFKEFLNFRKDDINLNIGIGLCQKEEDFYIISSPTLNTFSKKEAENYKNEGEYNIIDIIKVPVDTLKNIIDKYNQGVFPQFLNVDAEGIDELIINSIDYTSNFPLVMCVETISFSTSGKGIKNTALINFIVDNNYMIYADTHINTIFVRKDFWLNRE